MQSVSAGEEETVSVISEERAKLGYALDENEGEASWLLGMLETIKISRDDTAGQYGLIEILAPAGIGSPWHVHPEEDEWFYVLEGEMTFWVADTQLSLKAGSFAFGPKGVPHTFYAEAGGARALVGFAPMQFEGFLREVGEPAPEIRNRWKRQRAPRSAMLRSQGISCPCAPPTSTANTRSPCA